MVVLHARGQSILAKKIRGEKYIEWCIVSGARTSIVPRCSSDSFIINDSNQLGVSQPTGQPWTAGAGAADHYYYCCMKGEEDAERGELMSRK